MKELLKQYASYNLWANQKILELILALPAEKQQLEMMSSFPTLYKTALHLWDAETAWWQRVKLHERVIVPSDHFTGTMQDLSSGLLLQSRQWEEWVTNASELSLEHVFKYQNSKRESFKQPVFQVVLHVFNHSTYHRGQMVTMLRNLGSEKIPQTDFVVWSRKK